MPGQRALARGGAAQLEDGLVDERRGRWSRRGQAAPRSARPLACSAQERLVGRVLEQPAHEVGHARRRGRRPGSRCARAARGRRARAGGRRRGRAGPGTRRRRPARRCARLAATAWATERRLCEAIADADARPRASSRRRGERLEVAVGLGLDLEDRRLPAVLARLDDLVVPVGALDEPDDERRARARRRRAHVDDPLARGRASRAGRPAARARPTGRRGTRPRRAARARGR